MIVFAGAPLEENFLVASLAQRVKQGKVEVLELLREHDSQFTEGKVFTVRTDGAGEKVYLNV